MCLTKTVLNSDDVYGDLRAKKNIEGPFACFITGLSKTVCEPPPPHSLFENRRKMIAASLFLMLDELAGFILHESTEKVTVSSLYFFLL